MSKSKGNSINGTRVKDGTLAVNFGKYNGKTIEEIPSSYLRWMAGHFNQENYIQAAYIELQFRTDNNTHFED